MKKQTSNGRVVHGGEGMPSILAIEVRAPTKGMVFVFSSFSLTLVQCFCQISLKLDMVLKGTTIT